MIPNARKVASSPSHCDDLVKNTWISPNAHPIPRPNMMDNSQKSLLNEYRHPTWWDESRPWLPYIPVFDLSGNANHELFSVSRAGILSQSSNRDWYVSKDRIDGWKRFYDAVKCLCLHLQSRTRLWYSGIVTSQPQEVDYDSLNGIKEVTYLKLAETVCLVHDGVREWIGYFLWLWISRASEPDPLPYSNTLTTTSYSAFVKFLGEFSKTLRGVCIDFSLHPASEVHINQWINYNVPIHILLKRNGKLIIEVPRHLTVEGLGSRLFHSKNYNKMTQRAVDQNPPESPPSMYIWEPPAQSNGGNLRKRKDYQGCFFSFEITTPRGPYRIWWYGQKVSDLANKDESMRQKHSSRHIMAIFDDDWDETEQDSDGGYATSDEEEHKRYLVGKTVVTKVVCPDLPDFLDLDDVEMENLDEVPNQLSTASYPDQQSFGLEPMGPGEDNENPLSLDCMDVHKYDSRKPSLDSNRPNDHNICNSEPSYRHRREPSPPPRYVPERPFFHHRDCDMTGRRNQSYDSRDEYRDSYHSRDGHRGSYHSRDKYRDSYRSKDEYRDSYRSRDEYRDSYRSRDRSRSPRGYYSNSSRRYRSGSPHRFLGGDIENDTRHLSMVPRRRSPFEGTIRRSSR
jgi:hypothetical protein